MGLFSKAYWIVCGIGGIISGLICFIVAKEM